MPELRKDPVVGRWVIIATERVRRPSDFTVPHYPRKGGPCAFCAGRETETPPEILAFVLRTIFQSICIVWVGG